ncbi:MAG: FtsQ-type POTRA domain-containing protein [Limisphaerales bacterium]
MWFKRGPKNRRLNRGHVLDVKVRADQVRAARTRMVSIGLGVTFGTVFGLYLLWRSGEWALDKFIYENSTFAIQSIEVQTDGVIAPEQLRRWTNVKPGANLIALDLASVKRNLELVPVIDTVSIERVLPHTLMIRVTEREPVAQVNVPTAGMADGIAYHVFQLDMNGFVMKPLDPRLRVIPLSQMSAQLPEIKGLNMLELQPGHRAESPQVQAALQLIGAFDHSPMTGLVDLRSVDVSRTGVIVAKTGQGSEITFALGNMEQQLARWRGIYDFGKKMNKGDIATADLAVSNNVPVRWMAANGAPMIPPKKPKPAHNRRNNV